MRQGCRVLLLAMLLGASAAAQNEAAPTSVDALLARLATIELHVTVDRDFDGARRELDSLLAGTAAPLTAEPRAAATIRRIRDAIDEAHSVDREKVAEAVWQAAMMNDSSTLASIGPVATDLLLEGIRSGKPRRVPIGEDRFLSVGTQQMLTLAFRLDAGRTTAFVRDERPAVGAAGIDVNSFLVWALGEDNWTVAPGERPLPKDPALLEVVVGELSNARDAADIHSMEPALAVLAKFGALDERMCAEVARIV